MKVQTILGNLKVGSDLRVENYKELGLKSPKLSKALIGRGFDEDFVSLLIQFIKGTGLPLELTAREEDVHAQSDSAHFTSCQSPDSELNVTGEDARAAAAGNLYLAVVRTPNGFSYRVKVRRCLDQVTKETTGWFLDREYGQGFPTLWQIALLLKRAGEPAYYKLAYANPRFDAEGWPTVEETVEVPSAQLGYQDTFTDYQLKQKVHFAVLSGGDSSIGEIGFPLLSNPWRNRGILTESLVVFLYGPREETPTRAPEAVALSRVFRRLRQENPHVTWRRPYGRYEANLEYRPWGDVTAEIYASFRGVDLLVKLDFRQETRRWTPRGWVFVTPPDQYGDRRTCRTPAGFPGLTYDGEPIARPY